MNNKGFTLIELLATICLLAVIAVISFVSINGVLKKSKVSDCENLISNIKSATKEYVSDNRYNVTVSSGIEKMNGHIIIDDGTEKYIKDITAKDLINTKKITSSVKDASGNIMFADPFGGADINPVNVKIKVYLNDDYSVGDIKVYNADTNEVNCEKEEW